MKIYRSVGSLLTKTCRRKPTDVKANSENSIKRRKVAYKFKHLDVKKVQIKRAAKTTEHYAQKGWVNLGLYDIFEKSFSIHNIRLLNRLPVKFWSLDAISKMIGISVQTTRKMVYKVFGGRAEDICLKINKITSVALPTRLLIGFFMACIDFTDLRYLFFTFKKYKIIQKKPKRVRAVYISDDAHSIPLSETQYLLEWWAGLTKAQKSVILNRATPRSTKSLRESYKALMNRR